MYSELGLHYVRYSANSYCLILPDTTRIYLFVVDVENQCPTTNISGEDLDLRSPHVGCTAKMCLVGLFDYQVPINYYLVTCTPC